MEPIGEASRPDVGITSPTGDKPRSPSRTRNNKVNNVIIVNSL